MSDHCSQSHSHNDHHSHLQQNFDGASPRYRRALIAVILINATLFIVELVTSFSAQSQALLADALDFLMDTVTYSLSLLVIGKPLAIRSKVALFKGYSLGFLALLVLGFTLYRFIENNQPEPVAIGLVALLALLANVCSLLILVKFKRGDANVRSVWLCSRNDAIGNGLVLLAAVVIFFTASHLPDLIAACFLAALFLKSSFDIIQQANAELKLG